MEAPRFAELDYREADAGRLRVTLLWDRMFHRTVLKLEDDRADLTEVFGVPAHRALDAFAHPYVYMHATEMAVA